MKAFDFFAALYRELSQQFAEIDLYGKGWTLLFINKQF